MRARRPTDNEPTAVSSGPPDAPSLEISTPTELSDAPMLTEVVSAISGPQARVTPPPIPAARVTPPAMPAARVTPPPMRAAASHPQPPARVTPLPMYAVAPPRMTPPAMPAVAPIENPPSGEPLRMISMKDHAQRARADEPRALHQVQLRNLSEMTSSQEAARLGNLAPPRDPHQPIRRRLRQDLLWIGLALVLAGAISAGIWLIAGR